MKIAVIGFGAAAIGLIESLKKSEHEIHVYEKSPDIYSSSISGIRADGKLFVSSEMGGNIQIDLKLQKKLVDYYISNTDSNQVETGKSFKNPDFYRKFYQKGFQPIEADFYHIGTDQLKEVLFNIYEDFKKYSNIHFHFDSNVESVTFDENFAYINEQDKYEKVYIAVGRSGHKLVKNVITKYPDMVLDNTKVDLGIRYELPNHIVEELNKEMYEFKVLYRSKTGYTVRTFCNNPSGFVVNENYGDFVTVNGHAKLREKSTNTNFAILVTVKLTEPFNDPIGYGSHIAKLSNLLAGKNRSILQTYKNFKDSKRTKNLYRVLPTLEKERYIFGDINLAFPRRIIESIVDFIENLNELVPGVANADNLVHAPEIKFYSNLVDNEKYDRLKFIGDCSGATRSIIYATAHGYVEGEKLL
ncbi:MAG: NAD(P)/FAD-dependent oxidoreductase [Candidatus Delongbacteria bacterium]|nr:NAD(P)/FAD-dependent oxidoreductase [Candidatus Delongbacteria bacterium]MBN2836619.1 NAD(P)/FAD-dependent oxidoreductase [Candidatus Delongbacteria bacterium]